MPTTTATKQSRKAATSASETIREAGRTAGANMWGLSLSAYEDLFQGQAFSAAQKMQSMTLDFTKRCLEKQTDFAMRRWNDDLEFASSISECRDPKDATEAVQGFYNRMFDAYQEHFTSQSELLQNCVTESLSTADELRDTATELGKEAGKTAEKAANDAGKAKAA
ncbi:phasin family protein [Roseibium limicola]|uniref:Phasin family protein n=1 Tax=Roseibium limicola TaxID=2816037 RepID=A0A939ERQ1_9HYPH|nr:phasin family protein [Roseibium limicola]MBO0347501.1 phasin family protein [Roseibium limicola]